jgi:hypothetical protein
VKQPSATFIQLRGLKLSEETGYVVVECVVDLPGYPRFGFATLLHAEELGDSVRCLDRYASIEAAAQKADRLNRERRSAGASA